MSYWFPWTPDSGGGVVQWDVISERFEWVRAMRGVPQEARWHAEGDVHVHTRMVCEALVSGETWRGADEQSRNILFAAALLHDVAKPVCTVEVDGQWTSPRHTVVGERMARELLAGGRAGPVPGFANRETIAKLVRYHGLPLRFTEKPDPARAVIECAMHVSPRVLAALVTADVLGRECADKGEMLASLEMFTQFAGEMGCADGPAKFESAHHRFMYFVGGKSREYVPFDDTKFEVVLLSGLPGSGKSTWVRGRAAGWAVISPDEIRAELGVDPGDAAEQGRVGQVARDRAKELLRAGKSFVWDATNISRDMRAQLVALCAGYGAFVRIVYVEAPWGEMLARNRARKNAVPESVMGRLMARLEVPSATEAHEVEFVVS